MRKWIWLILLVIFTTGCDAEYNITINKATIVEELEIYEDNIDKWDDDNNLFSISYKEAIENNLNYKLGVFFDEQLEDYVDDNPNYTFYRPQKISEKDKLGIKYNYRFNTDNYNRAYFPRNCFDKVKVYEESGYITISTSKGFKCLQDNFGLNNLTINIKTKYEVENSNADFVEGRTHSWNINNSNYNNKNIYIRIDTKKLSTAKENKKEEQIILKALLSICITIAILLIIVIIFLVNKKRNLENY